MPESERLIAARGLDCTDCDMRQAATNLETQRKSAIWFNVPPVRFRNLYDQRRERVRHGKPLVDADFLSG